MCISVARLYKNIIYTTERVESPQENYSAALPTILRRVRMVFLGKDTTSRHAQKACASSDPSIIHLLVPQQGCDFRSFRRERPRLQSHLGREELQPFDFVKAVFSLPSLHWIKQLEVSVRKSCVILQAGCEDQARTAPNDTSPSLCSLNYHAVLSDLF